MRVRYFIAGGEEEWGHSGIEQGVLSSLDGGEHEASCFGRFTPEEKAICT
jgi:hypothetical protein